MDEATAKAVLGKDLCTFLIDGAWVSVQFDSTNPSRPHDKYVLSKPTADQLEALAWWMRDKGEMFWLPVDEPPGWQEAGRTIEIECDDLSTVIGKLLAADGFRGTGEYPIFEVEDADGVHHQFSSATRWRFVDAQ